MKSIVDVYSKFEKINTNKDTFQHILHPLNHCNSIDMYMFSNSQIWLKDSSNSKKSLDLTTANGEIADLRN